MRVSGIVIRTLLCTSFVAGSLGHVQTARAEDSPPSVTKAGATAQPAGAGANADPAKTLLGDEFLRPMKKPKVSIYGDCRQLIVPKDAAEEKKANEANLVGGLKRSGEVRPATPAFTSDKPDKPKFWCRDEEGERQVDVLAKHDETVALALQKTLEAQRLEKEKGAIDLQINEKQSALVADLQKQVEQGRLDVRKEVEAGERYRKLMIVGWSVAGAFLLSTVAVTTVLAIK